VEEDAPPTLEERVSDMEQWLTRKLHKRMDKIDEKRLKNSHVKLTSEEMKKKIVQLSADIQTELVKKMDKMEQARRKELMKKVQKLQETIENGGKEVDDDENENDKTQEHPAEGSKETEGTALSSAPPAPQSKDEEEVLDANNSEEVYKLTGGEGEEDDDEKDDDEEIIIDVACGGEHTCLLSESGKVYTFGQACQGQLGLYDWNQHGKIPAVDQPRAVECLGRAKGLSVTAGNACTIVMMLRPEPPSLVDICKGVLTMIREERIVLDDNIYKKTKK
jgi:hypothetical protein